MNLVLKEKRQEYMITQKQLSELTDIPLRTIENWESGKRKPSPWVEKLIQAYLTQYPKNDQGIITESLGTYTLNQIKEILLKVSQNQDISRLILFGSYAHQKANALSDIDIVVDGNISGLPYFGYLEDLANAFVKKVDLIHIKQIKKDSPLFQEIMKGVIVYDKK